MRAVAFVHAGAGSLSWTADADYNFVNLINNSAASSFLSVDPEMTSTANLPTVSVDRVLMFLGSSASRVMNANVKIPIRAGRTLTHTAGAGVSAIAYLEEADFSAG